MDWQVELIMALRAVIAAVLGGFIGAERERHGQDAGIRTYGAVALGACVFIDFGTCPRYQRRRYKNSRPGSIWSWHFRRWRNNARARQGDRLDHSRHGLVHGCSRSRHSVWNVPSGHAHCSNHFYPSRLSPSTRLEPNCKEKS